MDTFTISQEEIIALNQHAAVGRLFQGLIHNLNGPLHALGIEMDMMAHVISKSDNGDSPLAQDILRRLRRMGTEFDALSGLIRTVAARSELLQGPQEYLQLNSLLKQELEFLKANLYFKHNVKTTMDLAEGPPAVSRMPEGLGLGMVWFLQGLVEEMERQKLSTLSVRTEALSSAVAATFTPGGGELSSGFAGCLGCSSPPVLGPAHHDQMGLFLALQVLKGAQVAIDSRPGHLETSIRLIIPCPR